MARMVAEEGGRAEEEKCKEHWCQILPHMQIHPLPGMALVHNRHHHTCLPGCSGRRGGPEALVWPPGQL
eukprot:1672858-Karenia_brevis.AAC.1